ncbi:MAG: ABC transporter permease [Parvibaculaceae bacterium]
MRIPKLPSSLSGAIGSMIVLLNFSLAALAPLLAPFGEADQIGDVWAAPSAEFILGLDNLGRDMLSRLLFGGRTSISISLCVALLSFSIGISLGLLAALARGWIDEALNRLVDLIMSIPTLIFSLIILSMVGTSIPVLIGTIALFDFTRVFRLSRALGLNIAAMEFVEAARLRGEGWAWVIGREMLRPALPPLVAEFGLRFCFAFLFIASLSFLGLGVQPPHADWGGMVRDNAAAINLGIFAPLIPAAAIAQLTIGVNLLIDWYSSSHNSRLKHTI